MSLADIQAAAERIALEVLKRGLCETKEEENPPQFPAVVTGCVRDLLAGDGPETVLAIRALEALR